MPDLRSAQPCTGVCSRAWVLHGNDRVGAKPKVRFRVIRSCPLSTLNDFIWPKPVGHFRVSAGQSAYLRLGTCDPIQLFSNGPERLESSHCDIMAFRFRASEPNMEKGNREQVLGRQRRSPGATAAPDGAISIVVRFRQARQAADRGFNLGARAQRKHSAPCTWRCMPPPARLGRLGPRGRTPFCLGVGCIADTGSSPVRA